MIYSSNSQCSCYWSMYACDHRLNNTRVMVWTEYFSNAGVFATFIWAARCIDSVGKSVIMESCCNPLPLSRLTISSPCHLRAVQRLTNTVRQMVFIEKSSSVRSQYTVSFHQNLPVFLYRQSENVCRLKCYAWFGHIVFSTAVYNRNFHVSFYISPLFRTLCQASITKQF